MNAPRARRLKPGVDREHNSLRAKLFAQFGNQFGAAYGGGVDGHLVRPRNEDASRVAYFANATADSERNKHPLRGAEDDVHHRVALVRASGDVEKYNFVRALFVVTLGELHRIAGIAQVYEIDALDDTARRHIEAGNDSLGKH